MTDEQERDLERHVSADLVDRIANGDEDAEQEFCSRYYQRLLYFLKKRTSDAALAEDLCQQAFLKCLQKLRAKEIKNSESLAAFLHGIALHDFKNEARKTERRATDTDVELVENAANQGPGAIESLSEAQVRSAVKACLEKLSPSDRDVLIRLYLREESRESICASEGYSPRQFNNIVWRAKQRLRRQFLADADEESDGAASVARLIR